MFDLPKPNICGDNGIHVPTLEPCDDCERLEREFEEARQQAVDAAASAEESAAKAEESADSVLDLNVESVTLPPGSDAYVTKTIEDDYYLLTFGIPKGNKGDTGATGTSIVSIEKTGTVGLVDTYTITFSDGNTTTFTVTNGQNGTGSGTVSEVDTGAGLTGGPVTATGTIKAKMIRDTNGTLVSATPTEVAGRQYPVVPDANGNLSTNVPWTDTQADWNATSGSAEILNKPTLADVALSGDYDDLSNKPTIPTVPTNVSAFTNDSGYQTASQVASAVTEAKVLQIDIASFSSLPQTVNNSAITADHVVVNSVLGIPSAQTGDWTVTTGAGTLTVSGSMSGSTTLTLYLADKQ